jgi:hypothetical protein
MGTITSPYAASGGPLGTVQPPGPTAAAGFDPNGQPALLLTNGGALGFTLEVDPAGDLIIARAGGASLLTLEASDVIKVQDGFATSNLVSKTAGYIVAAANAGVFVNATAAPVAITLQAPAAVTVGQRFIIIKTDASANAVVITPAAGTISGQGSLSLTAQFQAVEIINDGANYWTMATNT